MEKIKGLYVVYNVDDYSNKIVGQINAAKNSGINFLVFNIKSDLVQILELNDNELSLIKEVETSSFKDISDFLIKQIEEFSTEIIYIRRLGFNIFLWRKTVKILKQNLKQEIYYEIPTYPFDKLNNIKGNIINYAEAKFFKFSIKKHIDHIPVVIQNDVKKDEKFIEFYNSISENNIIQAGGKKPEFNDEIRLLFVAHLNYWHGLDRLLNSLKKYTGIYKIHLNVVSEDTRELSNIKKLIRKLNFNSNIHIQFSNSKKYDEIVRISQDYHLGIGGLGYFRRGGKYDTSIKNKEYCALGLPFVIANHDKSFPDNFLYTYKVSSDESIFIFEEIIMWYESIHSTNYKEEMIKYAKNNLLYDLQMKKIFESRTVGES